MSHSLTAVIPTRNGSQGMSWEAAAAVQQGSAGPSGATGSIFLRERRRNEMFETGRAALAGIAATLVWLGSAGTAHAILVDEFDNAPTLIVAAGGTSGNVTEAGTVIAHDEYGAVAGRRGTEGSRHGAPRFAAQRRPAGSADSGLAGCPARQEILRGLSCVGRYGPPAGALEFTF